MKTDLFQSCGLCWVFQISKLPSFSGTPIIWMLVHLILSHMSLRVSSVLFIIFTLFCSSESISTILSSSSLIHSSASDILLLIPSRVLFILVIVLFVSVCLFFMASLTRWTWVWVNSWSWWWTGRPGVQRFMGSQRVGHDWATDLIWSDLTITADGDCRHESKRHLLLGRKTMTNIDSMLKSREITLPKKVPLVKAVVFPVVIYRCEGWTIKKPECWRIDAFELWC